MTLSVIVIISDYCVDLSTHITVWWQTQAILAD